MRPVRQPGTNVSSTSDPPSLRAFAACARNRDWTSRSARRKNVLNTA